MNISPVWSSPVFRSSPFRAVLVGNARRNTGGKPIYFSPIFTCRRFLLMALLSRFCHPIPNRFGLASDSAIDQSQSRWRNRVELGAAREEGNLAKYER